MGTVIATFGAICVVVALTLVRYQYVSGNSHTFAILQAIGSGALALSTVWQFNIGTLLLEAYCVCINLHTIEHTQMISAHSRDHINTICLSDV